MYTSVEEKTYSEICLFPSNWELFDIQSINKDEIVNDFNTDNIIVRLPFSFQKHIDIPFLQSSYNQILKRRINGEKDVTIYDIQLISQVVSWF